MSVIDPRERAKAHAPTREVDFYAEALKASEEFRKEYQGRMNVVKGSDMPFERSPDGLIKHIINEKMNTKECCLDIYMQFLPPGKASGKHRHLAEECLYVVEGHGYDLHQDCDVEIIDTYRWQPQAEIKRFEWEAGDVIYVPPSTIHQHFNDDARRPARLISCTTWFDRSKSRGPAASRSISPTMPSSAP